MREGAFRPEMFFQYSSASIFKNWKAHSLTSANKSSRQSIAGYSVRYISGIRSSLSAILIRISNFIEITSGSGDPNHNFQAKQNAAHAVFYSIFYVLFLFFTLCFVPSIGGPDPWECRICRS